MNPSIPSFGMGRVMNKLISFFLLTGFISASELEWKADFRYRLETDKTDSLFSSRPSTINYTRSRISLKFINGPIAAFAQLQDSRVLGYADNLAGSPKPSLQQIEFHQIYFQVNNLLKRNWTMRFGRFEIPLGSERLFSKNNWNNYGRSFEGIQSFNQNKFGSINTFYLINVENFEDFILDEDDTLPYVYNEIIQGLYFIPSIKKLPLLVVKRLSFYFYNCESEATTPVESIKYTRGTIGARISIKLFFLQFENETAFQYGAVEFVGSSKKIDSRMQIFNIHADLTKFPIIENVSFGSEYFSGNTPSTKDDLEGFANPWGAGHKYHGYFDRHTRFNDNFQNGLDEWNVKAEFALPVGVKMNIHYHNFKDGVKSGPLGTELDIIFSKKLGFGGVLQQGFARYWEEGGDQLDYSWFMLTFTL